MASSRLPSCEKVPCTMGSIYFAFGAARFGFVANLIALSIATRYSDFSPIRADSTETSDGNKFRMRFLLLFLTTTLRNIARTHSDLATPSLSIPTASQLNLGPRFRSIRNLSCSSDTAATASNRW